MSEKRFGGDQSKDVEKARGEENWWGSMNPVREGSRDSALTDLSQGWGLRKRWGNVILSVRTWVNVCGLEREDSSLSESASPMTPVIKRA